jgi:hypothetical protein
MLNNAGLFYLSGNISDRFCLGLYVWLHINPNFLYWYHVSSLLVFYILTHFVLTEAELNFIAIYADMCNILVSRVVSIAIYLHYVGKPQQPQK